MAAWGGGGEDVYATLLLTDTYLPGALVLAHSLRDTATTKKLAALVTLDSISAATIAELKSVYHYVIPVPRIRNAHPANLQLMNRTDLHSAFTKINLWKQTQFRKIVYMDADVVAYRAPDELFDIAHPFSAAPDIGWPDLFNTGVMVLTPNMGDYYAMMAMTERGISFDGADQGLINTHFRNNYNRISFAYNVTPSAHYQYIPAYRHFQSSINMVHFIGSDKPWFKGRHTNIGSSPFDEMTGRWWAVYDRHYRAASAEPTPLGSTQSSSAVIAAEPTPGSEFVQSLTKGEYQPKNSHEQPSSKHYSGGHHEHEQQLDQTSYQHDSHSSGTHSQHDHQIHDAQDDGVPSSGANSRQPEPSSFVSSDVISPVGDNEGTQAEAVQEQMHAQGLHAAPSKPKQDPLPFQPSMSSWDAQRHPPPAESKPEAINFPATIYEMSTSAAPFIAPQRYPSPPKGMWYDIPKETPAASSEPLKPIFPWETRRSTPSRVFVDEGPKFSQPSGVHSFDAHSGEQEAQPLAESIVTGTPTARRGSEPLTPTTPTIQVNTSNPWTSYSRTNAWDEVPEIERYVDFVQRSQKPRSRRSPGTIGLPSPGDGIENVTWRRRGTPIHRPNFWGDASIGEGDVNPLLPSAEGVPGQGDWDPVAQLQKLAKQQSEELLKRLGRSDRDSSNLPPRLLPFGSEELVSPTYVARSSQVLSSQPVTGSASSDSALSPVADLEVLPRRSSPTGKAVLNTPVPASQGVNAD
ncbi:hypothetical protein EKO27_g7073 [Xylaria grammica]|uniref:glycogenin glucosyltransferase n=1 Tax=Xylaria grammica TaxID=363999 RepID=A0A439D1C8_9PEZI|nr:hypothetical protein EKO27_g7073 [Xylaria grammica]